MVPRGFLSTTRELSSPLRNNTRITTFAFTAIFRSLNAPGSSQESPGRHAGAFSYEWVPAGRFAANFLPATSPTILGCRGARCSRDAKFGQNRQRVAADPVLDNSPQLFG